MGLKFLDYHPSVPYIAETLEIYKKEGIGIEQGFYKKGRRPGLLIVDMSPTPLTPDEFSMGEETWKRFHSAVENTAALAKTARQKGCPVFFTVCSGNHKGDVAAFGPMGQKSPHLLEDTLRGSGWATFVDKRVGPEAGDHVVEKLQPSAYIETGLNLMLTFNRIDTCIIAGFTTSGCVRVNAIDTMSRGYNVVVVEDCCADRAKGPENATLFDLYTKYTDVSTFEDVSNWLNEFTDVDRKENPPYFR